MTKFADFIYYKFDPIGVNWNIIGILILFTIKLLPYVFFNDKRTLLTEVKKVEELTEYQKEINGYSIKKQRAMKENKKEELNIDFFDSMLQGFLNTAIIILSINFINKLQSLHSVFTLGLFTRNFLMIVIGLELVSYFTKLFLKKKDNTKSFWYYVFSFIFSTGITLVSYWLLFKTKTFGHFMALRAFAHPLSIIVGLPLNTLIKQMKRT